LSRPPERGKKEEGEFSASEKPDKKREGIAPVPDFLS